MLRPSNALWVITDTHFGHKNIIKYQQRPETHDVIMLSEWIRLVPERAQILHLGDVFLGSRGNAARWAQVIARLPGEKYLILGNHDEHPRRMYEDAGFTIIEPFIHDGVAFTHRPITPQYPLAAAGEWHTNIHGHIHTNVLGTAITEKHDGTPHAGKRYINVCVEVTEYRPRQLGGILTKPYVKPQPQPVC